MTRRLRKPVFSVLSDDECRAVLGRNHVGHLAYLKGRVVDLEPVHYVLENEWILVRSAAGGKLEAFAHNPYVAFEVDEIRATFDWQSVVAHGTVYVVSETNDGFDQARFERAVDALRSFIPETLTADDPVPFRSTIFGIHLDTVSGRKSEQRTARSARKRTSADGPVSRPRIPDGF